MNKNSLLNQIYICPIGADGVQDVNLINPLYVEADPIYGIWIYDPRDETQLPIVLPEEGFMFTEAASADPRALPPLILDEENRFLLDPGLVADGEAVISIRSVYDFDGTAVADIDALADPAQTTTADQRPARFLRIVKAVSLPDEDDIELEDEAFGPVRVLGMKEIVGYSMVEPDGSVMMKVPANTALQISVVDGNGRRITARHQNWIQLRPGQLLECTGCHVAQGGMSHGRFDAFDTAYDGADVAGTSFNSGTVDVLFVGDIGETMAEVRARISCLRFTRAVNGHCLRRRVDGRAQSRSTGGSKFHLRLRRSDYQCPDVIELHHTRLGGKLPFCNQLRNGYSSTLGCRSSGDRSGYTAAAIRSGHRPAFDE